MSGSRRRDRRRGSPPADTSVADPARAPLRSGAAVAAMIGIAAATALAYSNTMGASFQFDDVPNIVENTSLRDLSSLWPPSGRRWVGVLTFALNYRWGGLAVPGYHAVNLLIHLCNALLVSLLAATTLRTPAVRRAAIAPLVSRFLPVTSGLLFAIHPLATESVTYVVQRFTSLATLFFLLSLTAYVQARLALDSAESRRLRAIGAYVLSVLAAVAAMKTKEIAFTLPIVAAAYDLLFLPGGKRRFLLAPLAAAALLVPIGVAS